MYRIGTLKIKVLLIISSREFRDNQASYFDRADNGEEILIQRGKNKSYKVIAISDDDTVVKKEHILMPDADLARAITMDELLIRVKADIRKMFKDGKK